MIAVMVGVPTPMPVASPPLVIVAAAVEELQAADGVRSCLVLSVKIPVALNCRVVPFAMLGLVGVTSTDDRVAFVTVSVTLLEKMPLNDALMVVGPVEPVAEDVASPVELMVAIAGTVEFQTTCVVRSWVVLSVNVPIAANCWLVPRAMVAAGAGDTPIDTSVAFVTVRVVLPETPAKVAVMSV